MNKALVVAGLAIAFATLSWSQAGHPGNLSAPEIDGASAASALALTATGIFIARGRRKKR
jgi:hypothetical protein